MATEAYIPTEVTYRGAAIEDAVLVTLYDAEGAAPHGSMTTPKPLPAGERGGPFVVLGTREKKEWRVTLAEIEVRNKTAVGFEYVVHGDIRREVLKADDAATETKAGPRLENLGATF